MIALLGHLAIVLALLSAGVGAVVSFLGGRHGVRWGRRAVYAVAFLVAFSVVAMEVALLTHDFSVKYVAEVGSRETPVYYTVISLWAALEGSILFWAFMLSAYTVLFLVTQGTRLGSLQRPVTGVLLTISSFFLLVIAGPGDPFAVLTRVPADGRGPSVLLQNHPMMGLHPPLLYAGYVGLAIPFAIVIGSLIRGIPGPDIMRLVRRWSLVPWICLSLGIVAGMWWSYAVLGWGGYWAWDPVENASIMPWLVATAFLHSLQVQERRQMLKTWTLSLMVAAFLLSILGTFLTRSGVLASVHSFTQSTIGPMFLAFFALVLVGSLGLLLARGRELSNPGALESSICRETAFLFNNLLFVALTFTILLGTVFPLIAEALQGTQLTVGAPYFNHVAVPIGFALLFLMGIGPVLPWGAARLEDIQYRLLAPVVVGTATVLFLLLVGVKGIGALVTFGASAFVLAVTIGRFVSDTRSRRYNTREGWGRAASRLTGANPRRYGGYLAHMGVLVIAIGIAASQTYGVRALATLRPGDMMSIAGYALVYEGVQSKGDAAAGRMTLQARVGVSRDGETLGTLLPSINFYTGRQQSVVTPAVREEPWDMVYGIVRGQNPLLPLAQLMKGHNPFEDVYLVLDNPPRTSTGPATIQALVNPMVGLIWLGGLMVGAGGVVALLPARRRRRVEVPVRRSVGLEPEEAVV